jgi:hypothetical protein
MVRKKRKLYDPNKGTKKAIFVKVKILMVLEIKIERIPVKNVEK